MPKTKTSNFCQVVRQHTEGMKEALYGLCWKFTSLSSCESIFKINRLGSDKVIAMNWSTTFL